MACGVRDRAELRHCHHLRFLISFGDKIWPLAIFLAKTFSFSKIIYSITIANFSLIC
jgi:hypothetical protein